MTIICSSAKVVLYDERPKMMRGTRQRKVFFDRKGLLFCRVSLFIFGRSSNVMAWRVWTQVNLFLLQQFSFFLFWGKKKMTVTLEFECKSTQIRQIIVTNAPSKIFFAFYEGAGQTQGWSVYRWKVLKMHRL